MIKSFRHDGLERFFRTGSKAGIQPKHAKRLALQLRQLDFAIRAGDMDQPGWGCHPLTGEFTGRWAVRVSGNYRVTFRFDGVHAYEVDYEDYH